MVRVMASGVFDIIHTGHLSYLEQAKAKGDELVVVVACDETVRKNKHEPVTPQVLGRSGDDIYSILRDIDPDIIVLGYDQSFDEKALEKKLNDKGYNIKVCRADRCADDLTATRHIIRKIRGTEAEK